MTKRTTILALALLLSSSAADAAPLGELLDDLQPQDGDNTGSAPEFLGTISGRAVFTVRYGEPNAFAWITDGTPEGTKPLEIGIRGHFELPQLVSLGVAGEHLFLLQDYQSDELSAVLAVDAQGSITRVVDGAGGWYLAPLEQRSSHRVVDRTLALALWNGSSGLYSVHVVDGDTLESTVVRESSISWHELLGAVGTDLVFDEVSGVSGQRTLWRSGGTPATTTPITSVPGVIDADRASSGGGRVFFTVQDPEASGTEVWTTDGTLAGTEAITSLVDPSAEIGEFHLTGSEAYFVVSDASFGAELFRSNGRRSGTRAVTDFGYFFPFSYQELVTTVAGRAFFVATDGIGPYGLWLAGEGPESSRLLVTDVYVDSTYGWIASAGSSAIVPTLREDGYRLVASDGTESGTHEVETGCAAPCDFFPESLASTSTTFYFTSPAPTAPGGTLYASRAPFSVAEPFFEALKEGPIIDYATPRQVAVAGDLLFFAAGQQVPDATGTSGEPWVTAGTPATTSMILRLAASGASSGARRFRTTGGALAFSSDFPYPYRVLRRSAIDSEVEPVPGAYQICYYTSEIYPLSGQFVFRDCHSDFWSFSSGDGPATQLTSLSSENFDRSVANGEVVGFLRWNGAGYDAWRIGVPGVGATLQQTLTAEEGNGEFVAAGEAFLLIRDFDPTHQIYNLGSDLAEYEPISPVLPDLFSYLGSAELGRGFFATGDFDGPDRIWTTDGTSIGTLALFPDSGSAIPLEASRFGDRWVVLAQYFDTTTQEIQVWSTDGTPGGSSKMAGLPYELSPDGASLASLPGHVLFTLRSSDDVAELWSVPADGGAPQSVLPPGVTIPEGAQAIRRVLDRIFFTACDASHGCELWSSAGTAETTRLVHDIRPGSVSSNPDQLLAVGSELVFTADDGQHGVEPWHVVLGGEESCVEGERALCLDGDRFLVRARWRAPVAAAGDAASIPLTTDTGAYWFFGPDNIELILKAIDGGGFNGHEWIFYGALSNVEYSIDVTDTATGHARRYFNPAGRFASVGDIHAFPLSETSPVGNSARPVAPDLAPVQETAPTGSCVPTETRFCILEGRFAVEAVWRDFQGRTGTAQAGALTDDTGYFWFFDDANIEIVVKAIDGSTYNGQFWIYYGALSNVEYTIRVTDTSTLAEREYRNPLGRFGSFGDIVAFPAP